MPLNDFKREMGNGRKDAGTLILTNGTNVPTAHLVSVSDLTDPTATDVIREFGGRPFPWTAYLRKDYALQRRAVKAGVLPTGASLAPRYAKEILADTNPDPSYPCYSLMTVVVPARNHVHGFASAGLIRPDLWYLDEQGADRIAAFYFPPVVGEQFRNATLPAQGGMTLEEYLVAEAVARIQPYTGQEIPEVLTDNAGSMALDQYLRLGFKVLIPNLGVPSLNAKGWDELNRQVGSVALLFKPRDPVGMPLERAERLVTNYLERGYGIPLSTEEEPGKTATLHRNALLTVRSRVGHGDTISYLE